METLCLTHPSSSQPQSPGSCDALLSQETHWQSTGLVQEVAYHCHIPFILLFPLFLFFPEIIFLPVTFPASLWAFFNVSFWQQSRQS